MPHIIVHYSKELSGRIDMPALVDDLHADLASRDTVTLAQIKTRAIAIEHSKAGGMDKPNEMICITLKLLSGRSDALKEEMGHGLLTCAKSYTDKLDSPCAVTVELIHLDQHYYQ